jgi:hypothetical protein
LRGAVADDHLHPGTDPGRQRHRPVVRAADTGSCRFRRRRDHGPLPDAGAVRLAVRGAIGGTTAADTNSHTDTTAGADANPDAAATPAEHGTERSARSLRLAILPILARR